MLVTVELAVYCSVFLRLEALCVLWSASAVPSVAALVVERRSLHASVPVFDLGVLHHVVKCLQALHHSEDAEHCLQTEENDL